MFWEIVLPKNIKEFMEIGLISNAGGLYVPEMVIGETLNIWKNRLKNNEFIKEASDTLLSYIQNGLIKMLPFEDEGKVTQKNLHIQIEDIKSITNKFKKIEISDAFHLYVMLKYLRYFVGESKPKIISADGNLNEVFKSYDYEVLDPRETEIQ